MLTPATPHDEDARLAELARLEVLDTPPEERYDRITRTAATALGVPVALVSLIDRDRQWFKSAVGVAVREVDRSVSMCAHAIVDDGSILEVADATADIRFAGNPAVLGPPHVRFYAGRPLHGPGGHRVGTLCVADVAPRHLSPAERTLLDDLAAWAERELASRLLAQTAEALARAERVNAEFVSMVSHELRTPLTSLRGSLGLLATGGPAALEGFAAELVDIALASTERLVRLVNDILDLDRAASGRLGLHRRRVGLAALVTSALDALSGTVEPAGVAVVVDVEELAVDVDPDRFVQVLVNLLGNAVKFSDRGQQVRVAAAADGADLELRVVDRGRGIPPDQLEAVFDRFHQVSVDDRRVKGGSGLGLPIVRAIVEEHGGSVRAESSPGTGATFVVRLPGAVVPVARSGCRSD